MDNKSRPDQVEVSFGISFNSDLDVIIAKVGVETSISVTLRWGK